MKLVKIKDSLNLHREVESNTILNTSLDEYNKYIQRRESAMRQAQRIDKIENDVAEIKTLLKDLIGKL